MNTKIYTHGDPYEHTSKDLERLIELMAKLPGLGPRSARRAVLHMVKKRALIMAPLADVLAEVAKTVRECLTVEILACQIAVIFVKTQHGPMERFA